MTSRSLQLIVLLATSLMLTAPGARAGDCTTSDANSSGQAKASKPAEGTIVITIKAPPDKVWGVLTNFAIYPKVFRQIESINVQKRDGNLVYVESVLKKQMFVKNTVQHTVNDLSGKPDTLKWMLTDGNFKHIDGAWTLTADQEGNTRVSYCLQVDSGPFVPHRFVGFALHFFEQEIVSDLKHYVERTPVETASANFRSTSD